MIPTILQNTNAVDDCLMEATTTSTRKRKMKRVTFGQIMIIEFDRLIGDNPSTLTGVPVTLGKQEIGKTIYDLEQYESLHKRPRTRQELKLSPQIRFQM